MSESNKVDRAALIRAFGREAVEQADHLIVVPGPNAPHTRKSPKSTPSKRPERK